MKRRLDTTYFGAFIGLLMPFVFGILFLDTIGVNMDLTSVHSFLCTPSLLIRFSCVALFPDMGAVFVLNSLEMWKTCRGVFSAIGIYFIVGFVLYYVL